MDLLGLEELEMDVRLLMIEREVRRIESVSKKRRIPEAVRKSKKEDPRMKSMRMFAMSGE